MGSEERESWWASGARGRSEADGSFVLRLDPGHDELHRFDVRVDGKSATGRRALVARRGQQVALPEAQERVRWVAVRCAGLPGDSCTESSRLSCGAADGEGRLLHQTRSARADGQPQLEVACPAGPAVVLGNGAAVQVPSGADGVWLDLRPITGSVSGVAPSSGTDCGIGLDNGLLASAVTDRPQIERSHRGSSDFSFTRLPPGAYTLTQRCLSPDGKRMEEVWSRAVEVGTEPIDLGTLGSAS